MKITNIDEAMEEAAKKQPAKGPKKMEKKPVPAKKAEKKPAPAKKVAPKAEPKTPKPPVPPAKKEKTPEPETSSDEPKTTEPASKKKALPKKTASAPAKTTAPTKKAEPKEEPKATEPEKPVQPWSAKGREANAEKRASMSSDEKQAEKDRSMRRMGFRQQGRGIGDRLKSAWKAFTGPAGGSTQHGQGKYKSVFHEIQRLMEQLRLVESILVHENVTAEGLTGGQKNLDVASPFGKLTAADFATLRARRDEIRSVLVGQMIREELHKHNTTLAELNPRQRAALSETIKQRSSKMWEQLAEMGNDEINELNPETLQAASDIRTAQANDFEKRARSKLQQLGTHHSDDTVNNDPDYQDAMTDFDAADALYNKASNLAYHGYNKPTGPSVKGQNRPSQPISPALSKKLGVSPEEENEAVIIQPTGELAAILDKLKNTPTHKTKTDQHARVMEKPKMDTDEEDVDEGKLSRLAAGLGLAGAAMMGGAQDAGAQSATSAQPQRTVQSFTMQRGADGNQVAVDAQGKPVKMQHTPADSVSTQKSRDMQLAVNKAEFDLRSKGIDPMASRDGKRVFKRDIVQNPDGTWTAKISPDRGESPMEESYTLEEWMGKLDEAGYDISEVSPEVRDKVFRIRQAQAERERRKMPDLYKQVDAERKKGDELRAALPPEQRPFHSYGNQTDAEKAVGRAHQTALELGRRADITYRGGRRGDRLADRDPSPISPTDREIAAAPPISQAMRRTLLRKNPDLGSQSQMDGKVWRESYTLKEFIDMLEETGTSHDERNKIVHALNKAMAAKGATGSMKDIMAKAKELATHRKKVKANQPTSEGASTMQESYTLEEWVGALQEAGYDVSEVDKSTLQSYLEKQQSGGGRRSDGSARITMRANMTPEGPKFSWADKDSERRARNRQVGMERAKEKLGVSESYTLEQWAGALQEAGYDLDEGFMDTMRSVGRNVRDTAKGVGRIAQATAAAARGGDASSMIRGVGHDLKQAYNRPANTTKPGEFVSQGRVTPGAQQGSRIGGIKNVFRKIRSYGQDDTPVNTQDITQAARSGELRRDVDREIESDKRLNMTGPRYYTTSESVVAENTVSRLQQLAGIKPLNG